MTGREIEIIMRRRISQHAEQARQLRVANRWQDATHYQNMADELSEMCDLLTSRRPALVNRRKAIIKDYDRRAAELMAQANTRRSL